MSLQLVTDPVRVRQVLRRHQDFLPSNALTSVVTLHPATLRILSDGGFALPPVLASATGDKHRRVRDVVAGFFSPHRVDAVGPRVAELAREQARALSAQLADGGRGDLSNLAQWTPAMVMSELIGLECPDVATLRRWSRHSLELFWGWPDAQRQLTLAETSVQFHRWLREQVLAAPPSGLFGALREAGMDAGDICSLGYFLVIAGQETTAQLIATAFYRCLQDRRRWRAVTENSAAAGFIRHLLATESSVHTWRRVAAHDTELDGSPVPAGTEILLQLCGQHGPDPEPTAYGLAFGYGLHRCLGARLAELEAVIVLCETSRQLPDVQLTGPEPEWLRLLSFQAPLTVEVAQR